MAEISFPRLEAPVNSEMWASITLGIGDGALDERGNPYNLVNFNNVNNTAQVAVDTVKGYNHAILKGFYHKMDSPITVSLPAVSTTTTYYIVLVYDPLLTTNPVTLKVVTSMPKTNGKAYLVLWTVVRKPNQLLTDSVVTKYRPTISPTIQVDYPDSLPAYDSVLFGTRARCLYTGEEFEATFNRWIKTSADTLAPLGMPGWEISPLTGGIVRQPVNNGYLYTWGSALKRTAEGYYISTSHDGQGNTFGRPVPDSARPERNVYFTCLSGDNLLEGRITPDGNLQFRSASGASIYFKTGQGISFQVSWWTAETPTALSS